MRECVCAKIKLHFLHNSVYTTIEIVLLLWCVLRDVYAPVFMPEIHLIDNAYALMIHTTECKCSLHLHEENRLCILLAWLWHKV